jgi:hypothetical protein
MLDENGIPVIENGETLSSTSIHGFRIGNGEIKFQEENAVDQIKSIISKIYARRNYLCR